MISSGSLSHTEAKNTACVSCLCVKMLSYDSEKRAQISIQIGAIHLSSPTVYLTLMFLTPCLQFLRLPEEEGHTLWKLSRLDERKLGKGMWKNDC